MSRKRILDPTVQKSMMLSSSLVKRVEAQPAMRDPLTGRLRHGAWRHLVETHLRRWLASVEAGTKPPTEPTAEEEDSPHG